MASPVTISLDELKIAHALQERLLKKLKPQELQPLIDDPVKMDRLVAFVRARCPKLFVEPDAHRRVRRILGDDFHGVDAMERHFGMLSEGARESYMSICLRDHRTMEFLTEERTLEIVEECKGTHVLFAVSLQHCLCDIHAMRRDRFICDEDDPWFGEAKQRQRWSSMRSRDPWILVRKDVVTDSVERNIEGQKKYVAEHFPHERFLLPVEFSQVAIIRFLETGEKLACDSIIRFPVPTSNECSWVHMCYEKYDKLSVYEWHGRVHGALSLLARTF